MEISDHAIVRYLDRGMGIDLDELKLEIMPDLKSVEALGNGDYPIQQGCKARVYNGKVVTVVK